MSNREYLGEVFGAAAEAYRRAGARRGFVDKALVCEFYGRRIAGARDWQDLRAIRWSEIHAFLRERGALRRSSLASEAALRRALYDIDRMLRPEMRIAVGIRTNGSLRVDVPPGAGLDETGPPRTEAALPRAAEPGGVYSVPVRIEAVAHEDILRLPAGVRLRSGAKVAVFAAPEDVREEPWAPRDFPLDLIDRMRGALSLGGDALVDSEAEPD